MDTLNTVTVDPGRLDGASQARRPGADSAPGGPGFASVLDSVQSPSTDTTAERVNTPQDSPKPALPSDAPPARYTVRSGDTLSGIAQNLARQRGQDVNARESYRLALDLAARNQIRNPDRIVPGQQLQLEGLHAALEQGRSSPPGASASLSSTQQWLTQRSTPVAAKPPEPTPTSTLKPDSAAATAKTSAGGEHPVLQQTLERAVAMGFIPAREKQAVQGKILQLAQKYQFAPDDFARMTLMESDGMNPRASNQRCHGIIQFCDGPNRGAAAVGYGQQPRAILGLSVYQQLHLVDNYFQDNGLGKQGPARLDDLYLTVLQPAARQEKQAHAPLNIPGPQARELHVGANTRQAITRQSIVQGLLKNTQDKLSKVFGQALSPSPAPQQIAQAPDSQPSVVR